MGPLDGSTLPAGRADGFYRDSAGVHVLTRHLTFFGLMLDDQAPTEPRDVAGVVAADGLTLRWVPGTDASGQLGNVVLFVNGEPYRKFGPTQYEAKLGAFAAGDTRTFTLVQLDAAGNVEPPDPRRSARCRSHRQEPREATAALGAAGFVARPRARGPIATVVPGTVVGPAGLRLALESSAVDLVVARGVASPETKLVFSVAGTKRLQGREDDDDRRPDQGLASGRASPPRCTPQASSASTPGASRSRRARTSSSCGCRRRCGGRGSTASPGSRAPARRRSGARSS